MYRENKNISQNVLRGDLYYADLSPVVGSEQGGVRPVLVIQNDVGNKYSPTVIIAAITSRPLRQPSNPCVYPEDAGRAEAGFYCSGRADTHH